MSSATRPLAALLVLTFLSGCLGGDDPAQDDHGDHGDGNHGDNNDAGGNGTGDGTGSPPTIDFSANATTIPAGGMVSIVLNASDDDGDVLSWRVDLDGDGTIDEEGDTVFSSLPQQYNQTFTDAGNFTLNATVSDGTTNVTATIDIEVTAPADTGEQGAEPVVYEGTVLIPSAFYNIGVSCTEDFLLSAATANNVGEVHNLPSHVIGWDYVVTGSGVVVGFFGAGAGVLTNGGTSGTVPDGAEQIGVCGETAVATAYTVTITEPA